jgi:hypothetical protein
MHYNSWDKSGTGEKMDCSYLPFVESNADKRHTLKSVFSNDFNNKNLSLNVEVKND